MRPPLDGTILITGASSGIGRELARQLAAGASRLVLVARRADRLEALAAELRARHGHLDVRVLPADLASPAAIEALVGALDVPVDVLINNAGLGDIALFETSDPDKLASMLAVNVTGLTLLTRALLPGMVQRRRGGVLNVSSGFGITWLPATAAYCGTKHYVTAFTEALRAEVGPAGVVVTQVCPGPVDTEFEEVAGNPFGADVPSLMLLTPEQCAAEAIAGFSKGRAMVVPGWFPRLVILGGAAAPRWVQRLFGAVLGRVVRRRLTG